MSATYTLHVPSGAAPGDPEALERADLVRDGFSWGAFLVPVLWFFSHRHWILGVGTAILILAIWFGLSAAGFRAGTIVAVEALAHLLAGFEGSSLRRLAYDMRGRPAADLVLAGNRAEAETKSFARWLATTPEARPASALRMTTSFVRRDPEPVIGLFPDAEGRP